MNVRKWIHPDANRPSSQQQQLQQRHDNDDDDSEEDEDEDDTDDDEEDRSIPVHRSSLSDGHALVIHSSDTAHVLAISHTSGFDQIDPHQLVNALQDYEGPPDCITASSFQHFLQNFIPLENLPERVRIGLVNALTAIFSFFEEYSFSDMGADFRSLCIGLSIFTQGSKSTKLGIGFQVFDKHREGSLTLASLSAFLSSYLLVLAAIGVIDDGNIAIETAENLTEIVSRTIGDSVSFTSFGEWYNSIGFKHAPWIELINLTKWAKFSPHVLDETGVVRSNSQRQSASASANPVTGGSSKAAQDEAFSILLHRRSFEMSVAVSRKCALDVFQFSKVFDVKTEDRDLFVIALHEFSRDGLIRKQDFEKALFVMEYNYEAKLHGGGFLSRLFDAFDRAGEGWCDTTELLIGLTVFFQGLVIFLSSSSINNQQQ